MLFSHQKAYHKRFPSNPDFPYIAHCEEQRREIPLNEAVKVLRLNRSVGDSSSDAKRREQNLFCRLHDEGDGARMVLNIDRRVTIDLDMPGWLTSIIGKPSCIFMEYSVVDSVQRTMRMFTENESWGEKVLSCSHWVFNCSFPVLEYLHAILVNL